MSTTALKQLFTVAFLGLTLVGCSSTPTAEDTQEPAVETTGVDTPSTAATTSETDTGSGTNMDAAQAVPTNADGLTADEIMAQLQGKVVNFDFDRSDVKEDYYKLIKLHADYMSLEPDATVTVQGHCDERGSKEYNLALGERRAESVKNALVTEGISPNRINVISFGEENPVDDAHNEDAWAKNRRAEFKY